MNEKRKLYLKLIDELDKILEKSGIKKVCSDCFSKKLYLHATAPDYINGGVKKKIYGCCKGCEALGKYGCTRQSIVCKLWLCSDKLVDMIIKAGYGKRWVEIEKIVQDNHWAIKIKGTPFFRFVRMDIDDYKELRDERLENG